MDDELYIHFVDAHSKSYCCDYNVDAVVHPSRLNILSLNVAELGVIKCTFHSVVSLKDLVQPFAFFPWGAVDDSALALKSGLQKFWKIWIHIGELFLVPYFVWEIFSIETALEDGHVVLDAKSGNNIIADFLSCCSCQTEDRYSWIMRMQYRQLQVIGSKILAPCWHAMHFVDDESVNLFSFEKIFDDVEQRRTRSKFLRCQIDYLIFQIRNPMIELANWLTFIISCGQRASWYTQSEHEIEVILYQGYQRHEHECDSRVCYCWELKGKTLATSSRNQGDCVLTWFCGVDDFSLIFSEMGKSEYAFVGLVNLSVPGKAPLPLLCIVLVVSLIFVALQGLVKIVQYVI